ncbi:aKG-HExxH-type peptide beta-hydroxylase [Actinomadura fibrosa]|uniref:HEXXH motif-containing putative peptide modification protein n=1 Tax=Actinomadura fibrosa TaxID=111802 RepID=A0ABW2XDZ6_9ACTN|nr:HEXXH motif-containing putative peptide modification protein [Actinomadura fibrosa]
MDRHRLNTAELAAMVSGRVGPALVEGLRAAELSKHQLLLEAVRRSAARQLPRDQAEPIEHALTDLADLQQRSPVAAREVIGRPQIGVWAMLFLRALRNGETPDTGYLKNLVRESRAADPRGSRVPRLEVSSGGLTLSVRLDDSDPHFGIYGDRATIDSTADLKIWLQRLAEAWHLLVRHAPDTAAAIAGAVNTLVPLRHGGRTASFSATSDWAFGAIALTLPANALDFAEILVHEFRHALLGAVTDLLPLLVPEPSRMLYSPWRRDPRPAAGLLHGAHAYMGLLDFWQRQGATLPAAARFLRWLEPTREALERLAASGALTELGAHLVTAMRSQAERWHEEPHLPAELRDPRRSDVARHALDAAADHRLHWRMRHLRPDGAAIEKLAEHWRARRRPFPVSVHLVPAPAQRLMPSGRSMLLERAAGRTADPAVEATGADEAHLLEGRYAAAAAGYEVRVDARHDPDAWVGLALCHLHLQPDAFLCRQPEVVAALHTRLRHRGPDAAGAPVDPRRLSEWLSDHRRRGD